MFENGIQVDLLCFFPRDWGEADWPVGFQILLTAPREFRDDIRFSPQSSSSSPSHHNLSKMNNSSLIILTCGSWEHPIRSHGLVHVQFVQYSLTRFYLVYVSFSCLAWCPSGSNVPDLGSGESKKKKKKKGQLFWALLFRPFSMEFFQLRTKASKGLLSKSPGLWSWYLLLSLLLGSQTPQSSELDCSQLCPWSSCPCPVLCYWYEIQ